MQQEGKGKGGIKCKDYCFYVSHGCGWWANAGALLVVVGMPLFGGAFQLFLADWVEKSETQQRERTGLGVGLALGVCIMNIGKAIVVYGLAVYMGKALHNRMGRSVVRARLSFFDANPLGRVLNRFSKDTAVLDTQLP